MSRSEILSAQEAAGGEVTDVEDEKFDLIYPEKIRRLSAIFWTPVRIAAVAAKLLVVKPETRVLDVGCGAGKFCLLGAQLTEGRFTGVEQRLHLVETARHAAAKLQLDGVEFLHRNVLELSFADYEAFYIFNPFDENFYSSHRIDQQVALAPELFRRYSAYVADQLGERPHGTRVVTYMGYADEIPSCYSCEQTAFGEDLKLWIKRREYDPSLEQLQLGASRSYRGSQGWQPPRR
ncbi:hypothetical protein BH20VER1_BH20VER1_14380 [soil metagenome]